jgi:tetratricopeptide (TPR) repeat protein
LARRADRGEVLLETVVKQLRELPSYVDTELLPPVVILDSTKSRDGQDVLAICTVSPRVEDGPINYLFVPEGNSRFRSLGVGPGDIVKYYILVDEDSLETGVSQQIAMELTVAQVENDSALYLEGGLNRPVLEPEKIEIWRYVDDRLEEISRQLIRYVEYRTPPLGWEPSPDQRVLQQMVERLNQWLRQSQPKTEWQADPLLETLDVELATDEKLAPFVTAADLGKPSFEDYDGRLLQEAVWLRDISRWAQGKEFDAVARATSLFDWTVRNVQLDAANARPLRPWQVLMYGHGTAEQRAWVFAMLCRQQGLDVVMLSVPPPADSPDATPGKTSFWLAALFHDDRLYLFDPRLGLPIPGPDGQGVATLAELKADPALLRQLDLDDAAYPVTAEQLQHVTANIVADPFDLSRRARLLEVQLTGDDQLALTSNAEKLVAPLQALPGIDQVRLWDLPFRTLRSRLSLSKSARRREARAFEPFAWRPTLWKARVLHFQGIDEVVVDPRHPGLEETTDDHAEAMQLYTSGAVRPTDRRIAELPQPEKRRIYSTAKANASYWMGLMLFDEGQYAAAENWLSHPKLAAGAGDAWSEGTRYNLARSYEAQGNNDEAIRLYEQDSSPQRDGNRLRARWLRQRGSDTEE